MEDSVAMEEGVSSTTGYSAVSRYDSGSKSLIRPSSMVMMNITEQDYDMIFWPKLLSAIDQLLHMGIGAYVPISYEEMYSCVYKCVCKGFSEKLHHDLFTHICNHLQRLSLELQVSDPKEYVRKFTFILNQYLQALNGIVPIFNYMNRFYCLAKLKADLGNELRKLFVSYISDKHIATLIPLLVEATRCSDFIPAEMHNLMKNLLLINRDYAQLRPCLFAKFITNVLPPCQEEDIERYAEEARQMQRDLLTHPDFIGGDQSRKRLCDEDSTLGATLCGRGRNS